MPTLLVGAAFAGPPTAAGITAGGTLGLFGAAGAVSAGAVLTATAIAATTIATTMSVQQAQQQARTASALAEFTAQTAKAQAKEKAERLKVAGREKQERILEERRRLLARNRAKFGKGGVTMEGSPLLVQQEVAKIKTQDAVMENYNTQIGVTGILTRAESEAQLSLLRGRVARTTGRLQVGQALFSGATQMASIGLDIKRAKGA